ncbi:PCI domain containing protein [Tritrichomonas foetus]|uniref:PCI domain containing protein n=1 Tax=Tritrichomonas foetus TaxID=1144522 RepID=A0A1J4JP66_9EUKA|nr:PCI domain containing protein [Tritrichomonas foetus]|eukprot:OHT00943.1 PCI domain containing protein [Tritrichomonas foetus]
MSVDYIEQLNNIIAVRSQDEAKCAASLEDLIDVVTSDTSGIEELTNDFEQILTNLLSVYVSLGDQAKFQNILVHLRGYFTQIPKARTAKLVRLVIQALRKVTGSQELQVSLCREWIEWAIKEERTLLRQRLETELAEILLEEHRYQEAIEILSRLATELRKVDFKSQLIEVYLIESRTFRGLGDFSRAKASLAAARTNAAAVYTSPLLQGQLDLESGIIFTEEKDYRTANSYFSEAFDSFSGAGNVRAVDALKYGLLCKILDGRPQECATSYANAAISLSSIKGGEAVHGSEIEAMLEIAKAAEAKSLGQLNQVMESRPEDFQKDPVVAANIKNLIDSLEEQHLLRIVKPYSAVELSRIAEMINLPVSNIESKLVQMILDQKLKASINQSDGILNIFEAEEENEILTQSIELISQMDGVVDALYTRCKLMS